MKVVTIIGTRPEIIRLSRVMPALDRAVEHVVVHTGQNYDYELNQVFFDDLGLRQPDHFLAAACATACATVGNIIARTDELLGAIRPDALLVLGDTNSCLAAYSAKRRQIPIFHMEAGNRCFDQRVPEEINRRIVDHISDINMPYSSISREYLLREGIPPDRVIKTGSPMFEVLRHYRPKADASDVLVRLGLSPGGYFLVSAHREENIDLPGRFAKLVELLNRLAKEHDKPVIVTTHPRTRRRMEVEGLSFDTAIQFHKPFGLTDYLKLQMNAACVLSDSGTITEESSILGFPALNIRDAHERPEGMEEAVVMMTGLEWSVIRTALRMLPWPPGRSRRLNPVADYRVPDVSGKVVRIIVSYTGYVNRTVWRKT